MTLKMSVFNNHHMYKLYLFSQVVSLKEKLLERKDSNAKYLLDSALRLLGQVSIDWSLFAKSYMDKHLIRLI